MRILHTGDTHSGARQYGLDARRADFAKAFEQVIEIAITERVGAVIHAGDLFDDRYPSAEDLRSTVRALFRLKEADVPFLGIVGNHEQRRGVQWLDLFSELDLAVHLGAEPYELGMMRVYGMDYAGRRQIEPLKIPEGSLLVCHQMLDKARSDGELHFDGLLNCGAHMVLLGDYHEHRVWRTETLLVTYCGSTERWSLDEREPRGISLIDLETGRLDRRELTTRPFIYIGEEEDPLKSIAAHGDELKDAILCVYRGSDAQSIAEIEERARAQGSLSVRVRDRRPEEAERPNTELEVHLDFGNLDQVISERLDRLELSELARRIDGIIRDQAIADSNVDAEVTKVLLEATTDSERTPS
jgi:DNA repair exonuclease SbcCD nuclease subunit